MTIDTRTPPARRPAPAPSPASPSPPRCGARATPSTAPRAGGSISYAELGRAIREIAGGLAELGIERGDQVAILAGTRPEWTLADFGALCAGATVVPDLPHQLARGVRVHPHPRRRRA